MHEDIYGKALLDFVRGEKGGAFILHTSYGDTEEMPIEIFFREENEFSELEEIALALCDGKVLDVGAGAGIHTLYLEEQGFEVEALDISKRACECMKIMGVSRSTHHDFFTLPPTSKYDTLLLLMNGIGLAGELKMLKNTLQQAEKLLNPGGQILFDSSDIHYLYEDYGIKKPKHYYGEIEYQYEYKGEKGIPFKWLFIDPESLIKIADEENWLIQFLYEDENDQYLVRMTKREL